MTDSNIATTFPNLRFWGIAETLYGLVFAALIAVFVPWKAPALNTILCAYSALCVFGGAGLFIQKRWGWRCSVTVAFLGFLLCILIATGLVTSWSYLRGIFGDFGRGASIGALLFASVTLEFLGLFPALALRALLRSKDSTQEASTTDSTTATTFSGPRFLSIAEILCGLVITAVIVFFVPWKVPALNALLCAYGALCVMGGAGLFAQKRWGWHCSVAVSFLGFLFCVLIATGLVASWAYLRGIFGDFGQGASIVALLLASVALEVLGLFPTFALRALLRSKAQPAPQISRIISAASLTLCALPFLAGFVVSLIYSVDSGKPFPINVQTESIAYVKAAIKDRPLPQLTDFDGDFSESHPIFISLWSKGELIARSQGSGDSYSEALANATSNLVEQQKNKGKFHPFSRIKIDHIVDRSPIFEPAIAISINPGLDGLQQGDAILLPDDLLKANKFGQSPIIPGIKELRLGLDAAFAKNALKAQSASDESIERIRTRGFIEPFLTKQGEPLSVVRGNTSHTTGAESWRKAAIAGGDFILRQIMEDGRFHYIYYPLTDTHPDPARMNYSLPRHAGTVYALARIYKETGAKRFRTGAERAIAWLYAAIPQKCGNRQGRCVIGNNRAELGSTALTMVGMLEYQRATKDQRYSQTVKDLAEFVLGLQKENGDFFHLYDLNKGDIDPSRRAMFYSEEAALALVMAHEVLGDERYLVAAERALDFLTTEKYSPFFLGHLIYGADHWTCIAADEAWPRLQKSEYLDFCKGYAHFIRRMMYEPGEWKNDDFSGHYGFGAVMVPQAPAAAGFTEAIISTANLARAHGIDDPSLETQLSQALDALARDQIRLDNSYLMANSTAARGGIRRSLVEQEVRIDFTQHAATALIRGAVMQKPLSNKIRQDQ